jgi:hypothetical protein
MDYTVTSNETGFFSMFAVLFSEHFGDKSDTFSFGKHRWARRVALETSLGRAWTGIFQV